MRWGESNLWGTLALVSCREGKTLAAGAGDVCVSAVGVYVGAGNGTAFCADVCIVCVCVYLYGTGELS